MLKKYCLFENIDVVEISKQFAYYIRCNRIMIISQSWWTIIFIYKIIIYFNFYFWNDINLKKIFVRKKM